MMMVYLHLLNFFLPLFFQLIKTKNNKASILVKENKIQVRRVCAGAD